MTPELLAMLGGGISGFVMKLIGTQMESQARQFERMITSQQTADASADAALHNYFFLLFDYPTSKRVGFLVRFK